MALVIRHKQLPIASVGRGLASGCSQRPGLGTNMVTKLEVSYCWFRFRTWHPVMVRGSWPALVGGEDLGTFLNPFSVSEVMRQGVGNNPSTMY